MNGIFGNPVTQNFMLFFQTVKKMSKKMLFIEYVTIVTPFFERSNDRKKNENWRTSDI